VQKEERRRSIGRLLAQHILRFAGRHYASVVLRTDTDTADRFYVAMGFTRLPSGGGATHLIEIEKGANGALKTSAQTVILPSSI
jgi:ribosomal protein S18 acetylase RimI-like enzyme